MSDKPSFRLIELPGFHDERGDLTFIEGTGIVPFPVKRVYWICNVPGDKERAGHAHKQCEQLIVALHGSFRVIVDDGHHRESYLLSSPDDGLLISADFWRSLDSFSSDAVCLVLDSLPYNEEDYIRDYREFIDYLGDK